VSATAEDIVVGDKRIKAGVHRRRAGGAAVEISGGFVIESTGRYTAAEQA